MDYNRINNLTGWAVFLIALATYLLTVSPTASFWDCGEFIACSYELEVTHPPGAPLFLLLGRLFSMFAFGDSANVAFMINLLSVLSSAFTALFTCWTVTMLAKKGLQASMMSPKTKLIATMAAGAIAGLTCTFADSIWFNAVEAEVYAMSSFFTAIVVWLMFKWEARADEPDHLKWIILIAYVMGLSIGVHLLNLLTIPALALLYYYRKFDFSWRGFFITMGISVVALALIQYGIIQFTFSMAWQFEKLFTGTMTANGASTTGFGLPFGTGATVFGILVIGGLSFLLYYSHKKKNVPLNTAVLAFTVICIGFSSYAQIFIRSNVNPPIDMNNPENVLTFLSYMRREQYGDRPLLKGPMYNAEVERDRKGYAVAKSREMKYVMLEGNDRYVEDTENVKYQFKNEVFFPRMYDPGKYENSSPFSYKNYVKRKGADPKSPYDDRPTRAEDFRYFMEYQLYHMYIRYFLWNFAGRESDEQDARWESGFERWDASRWSEESKNNKGKNHYYMIPLFLGILGLVWQLLNNKRDAAVIGMLFFFTGLAIILYLNQYAPQPRERDYSYAGSFQTFAMWVGLGVLFLVDIFYAKFKDKAAWLAGGLALLAPLLMASQNWDDHSRAGRWVDIEFAKNLLNSCAENAILFTGGDNDTFPLWYVQEVEDYRSDVRVVNLELLISDWYIEQMKDDKNRSKALPISMEKKDYIGEKSLLIRPFKSRKITLPVHKDALKSQGICTDQELSWAEDQMVWDFKSRGSQANSYILRKDSVMMNIVRNIANAGWDRPIYFANTMPTSSFIRLQDFFRMEGMAYRVVPIKKSNKTPNDVFHGWIGQDIMRKNLMEKFLYTNLDNPDVNFDEHIRQVIVGNYRNAFYRLCNSYAEQIIRDDQAVRRLERELALNPAESDSLQGQIDAAKARMAESKEIVRTTMEFANEKMPNSVIPKNYSLTITQAQMFDRIKLKELAKQEFKELQATALDKLGVQVAQAENRGKRFRMDANNYFLQGSLMAVQYLAREGEVEFAREIADKIEALTGDRVGHQMIDQEEAKR